MLVRVDEYMEAHPLVPANPLATAQIAIVQSSIASIEALGGNQDHGRGEFMGATDDRQRIALELRIALRGISAVAKVLDEELYPGAKAQFRLTGTATYMALLNRSRAFVEAIGPIKAAFVAHGQPPDFDETLAGIIVAMDAATARRFTGLHEQMSGTAGMEVAAKRGVKAVRVLDSILSLKLKDDPAQLAVWKAAQRIERDPVRRKPANPAPMARTVAGSNGQAKEASDEALATPRPNGAAALLA
jgi:hypothetical protein